MGIGLPEERVPEGKKERAGETHFSSCRHLSLSLSLYSSLMAVGVLALQGSYNEHIAALRRIGVKGIEIRKAEQLRGVDSLIIPGGESTTMAKLAELHNLFPALREFVGSGKPVWGTCAGLIFLANKATGQKTGGQDLVGGLDCTVHRNFFGSQLQSFEMELSVPRLAEKEGGTSTCRGVFIRAPAILEVGPNVEVIADCPVSSEQLKVAIPTSDGQEEKEFTNNRVIVAVKQGNLLATAFHPELTSDSRWHRYFLAMVEEAKEEGTPSEVMVKYDLYGDGNDRAKKPYDLPIFE
ncbi:Pyridoxal 5'-phosphate synthase subunit PdxT [Rhynchospora pubera]|uniref:glutaminase n=1 Tax=Rhynchospora pubera TaxID=906938 RepID=A0AAV8F2V2_9POAL|nr:Pyridoxal 5'-phosphate synthase subunit PdxT [Rhynchospora pubera]